MAAEAGDARLLKALETLRSSLVELRQVESDLTTLGVDPLLLEAGLSINPAAGLSTGNSDLDRAVRSSPRILIGIGAISFLELEPFRILRLVFANCFQKLLFFASFVGMLNAAAGGGALDQSRGGPV